MNNWICPKCKTANSDRFCLNCGEEVNLGTQSAPDLPPTVFGVPSPPIVPPNQQVGQMSPQFQPQQQLPPVSDAPKKSKLPKILLVVGIIIGLVVVGTFGMFVYDKTIGDHLRRQKWEQQEQINLHKANSLIAKDLLPESITINSQRINRGQVIDKFQMFDLAKNKLPEVNEDIKDINDAASARYASADKREAGLMIFKYNSPEQAKNACQKIGQEMIKNEKNFVKRPFFGYDDRIGFCGISGELKNGEYVTVDSLYGFLYITTGYKDYASELNSAVWTKLR